MDNYLEFTIPGISVSRSQTEVIVQSEQPMQVISSAVVNGGITEAKALINLHVIKNYSNNDPITEFLHLAAERGYPTPFVGLMTAAFVIDTSFTQCSRGGVTVAGMTTAGVSNAAASGLSEPVELIPGTINSILVVDANLTPAALVNAVITAVEAKTAVLHEFEIKTAEGYPATGTTTDSVIVACTGRGEPLPYAGSATTVGYLIARAVRETLTDQLNRREEFRLRYDTGIS